jgi:hypothetical protein
MSDEVIKVIEAWKLGFHLGNTVKYVARAGKKPGVDLLEDLEKARWYLDREIAKYQQSSYQASLSSDSPNRCDKFTLNGDRCRFFMLHRGPCEAPRPRCDWKAPQSLSQCMLDEGHPGLHAVQPKDPA